MRLIDIILFPFVFIIGIVLGFILLIVDFIFKLFGGIVVAIGMIVLYIAYVGSNLFRRRIK